MSAHCMRSLIAGVGMLRPMAKRDLNAEENERLRGVVRELLRQHDGNQSELAPLLGITQPALSGFLSNRQGTSWAVARRAAEMAGKNLIEMVTGEPQSSKPLPGDTHPNLTKAAAAARILGLSDRAINVVFEMRLKQLSDMPALDWLDDMRQAERQLARGLDVFSGARIVDVDAGTPKMLPAAKKARGKR